MRHLTTEAYLKRPYQRVLIPDPEKGGYTAKIAEFPGCVTEADTAAKALKRLEDVAESWIEAVLDMGQVVPEPMAEQGYSGKLMLRLSRSLHRRAAEMAHAEGVSLNQFIVIILAERTGTIQAKATAKTTMVLASPWPTISRGYRFLTGTEDLRPMPIVPMEHPPTTPDQAVR